MAEVYHGRGYVYSIQYHIVWCVKYRHKILSNEIESRLKEILDKIAYGNGYKIVTINGDLDRIHMIINCNPRFGIMSCVSRIKSITSKSLFLDFPYIKKYYL